MGVAVDAAAGSFAPGVASVFYVFTNECVGWGGWVCFVGFNFVLCVVVSARRWTILSMLRMCSLLLLLMLLMMMWQQRHCCYDYWRQAR